MKNSHVDRESITYKKNILCNRYGRTSHRHSPEEQCIKQISKRAFRSFKFDPFPIEQICVFNKIVHSSRFFSNFWIWRPIKSKADPEPLYLIIFGDGIFYSKTLGRFGESWDVELDSRSWVHSFISEESGQVPWGVEAMLPIERRNSCWYLPRSPSTFGWMVQLLLWKTLFLELCSYRSWVLLSKLPK